MLICKICGYEHATMISASHLKKHGITGAEYKLKYPNSVLRIQSDASKKKISSAKLGAAPWNKNKLSSDEQKNKQSISMKEGYKSGRIIHFNTNKQLSEETKNKISISNKGQSLTPSQAAKHKAAINRIINSENYVPNMKGKTHTEDSKLKISAASIKNVKKNRNKYLLELQELLYQDNINVVSQEQQNINLKCVTCEIDFKFTRQYFSPSSQHYHNSRIEKICPSCWPRATIKSKKELEILEFIKSLTDEEIKSGARSPIWPKELDIWIPGKNLAIEFCGNYWHAENVGAKSGRTKYHISEKHLMCEENGIRLITIFEDEWDLKQDIVKSRLSNLFSKTPNRVFARKLTIKSISSADSIKFLKLNHIQGADRPEVALGAFDKDELISVMTFKKTSYIKGGDGGAWELNRFASTLDTVVIGMAAKFISHFQKNYNDGLTIISYSDNRWSVGNVYSVLGFDKIKTSLPGYWYTPMFSTSEQGTRIHRSNFMRHRLHKIFNKPYEKPACSMSEWEILQLEGYDRIWDCGTTKWALQTNTLKKHK